MKYSNGQKYEIVRQMYESCGPFLFISLPVPCVVTNKSAGVVVGGGQLGK